MTTTAPNSAPVTTTPDSPPLSHLPDLEVQSTHGSFNLNQLKGHISLIYFYPKDMTAGCTTQAQDFRDFAADFAALGVKIYGVSRDSLKSHQKFTDKENLPFALISDPDEHLCRQFDVIKQKNMYGKVVQGIERSSFLFDEKGELLHSWRKVKATGHAEFLLNWLKSKQSNS